MDSWRLDQPWLLLLIIPWALVVWWPRRHAGVAFGAASLVAMAFKPSRGPHWYRVLLTIVGGLLVLAAARPQWGRTVTDREQPGRDLMLVIDLSLSMFADDMTDVDGNTADRLAAVHEAAASFIASRPNDRIGLVYFAERSLLTCPLTFDHTYLAGSLSQTEATMRADFRRALNRRRTPDGLLGSGTNIGLGLGIGQKNLAGADAPGRAIILITDGQDSRDMANWVDPIAAAASAAELGTRVYCIGVGNERGMMTDLSHLLRYGRERRIPVRGQWLPDQARLRQIAETGDGQAMRANNRDELAEVFATIDQLEPSVHTVRQVDSYSDRFMWPLVIAVLGLAALSVAEPRLRGGLA